MLTFVIDQHMVDSEGVAKTHRESASGVGDSLSVGEHVRAVDEDEFRYHAVIAAVNGDWIHLRLGGRTRVIGFPGAPTAGPAFCALLRAV